MENANGFVRPRFEEGMLLTASDLNTLQNYSGEKHRLVNYAMLGHGVVCGAKVESRIFSLAVQPGLVVDAKGREILIDKEFEVACQELFGADSEALGDWLLCVEYQEAPFGQSFVLPDRVLGEAVPNRVRESFRLVAKRERGPGDVCIARIRTKDCDGKTAVQEVISPMDGFSFAPHWSSLSVGSGAPSEVLCARGSVRFDGHKGGFRTIFSDEIEHGLGPGEAQITLSLKARDGHRDVFVSGDCSVMGVPVRMAAAVFPDTGSFRIGIRSRSRAVFPLCVHWQATLISGAKYRPEHVQSSSSKHSLTERDEPSSAGLQLNPGVVVLEMGQSAQFHLTASGESVACGYCLRDEDSGSIDNSGLYTAPMRPGLFCIHAQTLDSPSRTACAYALVRDKGD